MRSSTKMILAGAAGAAASAGLAYACWENNALVIERHTVSLGLASPLRIVQLADLHGKRFGKKNRRLLKKVQALSPDLILMTGDTVSDNCTHIEDMTDTVHALSLMAPVCLIPGNHERRSGRMEELLGRFSDAGAITLCDEEYTLDLRGTAVHVLGLAEEIGVTRTDYVRAALGRLEYPDRDALLLSLAQQDGLRIVLSHFPELFCGIGWRSYCRFDFDLLFAGHAHGGQVRLPCIGGLYAPGQGLFPKYTSGVYGDRPKMIVSRGLGGMEIIPRVNNRPEITCVDVQ